MEIANLGMSDANSVATAVRASLSVLHGGSSSPGAVQQASIQLNSITKALNPMSAIQSAYVLLNPVLNTRAMPFQASFIPEVHFGFHILEEVILRVDIPWASFPNDIRTGVRQIAVTLFQHVSEADQSGNLLHAIPSMVVKKVVALISGIAIREWPQRWPDFIDVLLAEPQRAEIVCLVLRALSEDIHEYRYLIEDSRRQELIRAMALSLPKTLGFAKVAAEVFYRQKNLKGLRTSLETLQSFLSWASLHTVFSAGVPAACIALLRDKQIRTDALAALSALVNRQFTQAGNRPETSEGKPEVDSEEEFRDVTFGGILQFVANSPITPIAAISLLPPSSHALPAVVQAYGTSVDPTLIGEEDHEFCLAFFTMLTDLGTTNFSQTFLFSKRKGQITLNQAALQCGRAYIDLMLSACGVSSLSLQQAVLPFFVSCMGAILKHFPDGPLNELSKFLVVGYLHGGCLALIRFPAEHDSVSTRLEALDSRDDDVMESNLRDTFKNRTVGCVALAARLYPEFAYELGLQRLVSLLEQTNTNIQAGAGSPHQIVFNTPKHLGFIVAEGSQHSWKFGTFRKEHGRSWYACLLATVMSTEAMINGAINFRAKGVPQQTYVLMQKAFQLAMQISEEELLTVKASALRIFTPLYSQEPQKLEHSFSVLIAQGTNFEHSYHARSKACLAINMLFKRLSKLRFENLARYRSIMCNGTVGIINSQQHELGNKESLLEASISTVLVGQDFQVQTDFIEQLFKPLLEKLSSPQVQELFKSPSSLYEFIRNGRRDDVRHVSDLFQLLEIGTHQVVRPLAKSLVPIGTSNVLSRSIAPKSISLAVNLLRSLHGLYNKNVFQLRGNEEELESALSPTCIEIATLLNLSTSNEFVRHEGLHDLSHAGKDAQFGSAFEERSDAVLRQHDIAVPDKAHSLTREVLKNLRKSGYEIMRSAILSGVTLSPSPDHLNTLLGAVTSDIGYIEPIHLVQLTEKILTPLFSYSVAAAGGLYLQHVANSRVVQTLAVIRENVEHAKLGEIVDSGALVLDVARSYGRKKLGRSAATLILWMYPRLQAKKTEVEMGDKETYLPDVFRYFALRDEMMSLWRAVCNPGESLLDNGAARVGLDAIVSAVDMTPQGSFLVFAGLLEISFLTARENSGLSLDSPLEPAIGALASILRKWPAESEKVLHELLEREGGRVNMGVSIQEWKNWVSVCIGKIAGVENVSKKKHRGLIKEVVRKIAEQTGVSRGRKSQVKALPEKLVADNPERARRRTKNEMEEAVLADAALDSLFGDGEPM